MPVRIEQFYQALQRTLRTEAGKALPPVLKRWRYTQSSDFAEIALKPATARFLIRYGLLDAGQPDPERARVHRALLTEISRASGDAPGIAAAWLDLFAEGQYNVLTDGICADEPRCGVCGLKDSCRYLATGGKEERASGEQLAANLLRTIDSPHEIHSASNLLAFLLNGEHCGAADYARAEAALKTLGGLRALFEADSGALRKLGFDSAAQSRLTALARLYEQWAGEQVQRGKSFTKGEDFYEHFHLRLRSYKKEVFYVTLLDQKNALIAEERVSEGSLTDTLVHPREVFALAVARRAASVAVIHNHPSGDPTPSTNDKTITKRLDAAAQLLGIRLLDHVIIGDGKYVSFVEKGLLR